MAQYGKFTGTSTAGGFRQGREELIRICSSERDFKAVCMVLCRTVLALEGVQQPSQPISARVPYSSTKDQGSNIASLIVCNIFLVFSTYLSN